MVALVDGGGADALEVGSRAGLGHGDGGDQVARGETGQPAALLLVVGEAREVGADDVVVQADRQSGGAGAGELLDEDGAVAEVVDAPAAVLLVDGHAEQSPAAGRAPHLAVHHPSFSQRSWCGSTSFVRKVRTVSRKASWSGPYRGGPGCVPGWSQPAPHVLDQSGGVGADGGDVEHGHARLAEDLDAVADVALGQPGTTSPAVPPARRPPRPSCVRRGSAPERRSRQPRSRRSRRGRSRSCGLVRPCRRRRGRRWAASGRVRPPRRRRWRAVPRRRPGAGRARGRVSPCPRRGRAPHLLRVLGA